MKPSIPTRRRSRFIRPAISTRPNNRWTSASTPISAAPQPCSIFWMRSAAIATRSWLIASNSPPTCSPSSNCGRLSAQGLFHEFYEYEEEDARREYARAKKNHALDCSRGGHRPCRRAHFRRLWLDRTRISREDDVVHIGDLWHRRGAIHRSARPNVAYSDCHNIYCASDAHAAPLRPGR